MILEIITGAIIGTGLMGGIGWWYVKNRQNNPDETPTDSPPPPDSPRTQYRAVERRLRHAITECERNKQICEQELEKLYLRQAELLDGIGRPSYIFVEGKPYAFAIQHPVTAAWRYYYQRDLTPHIAQMVLDKTLSLAQQYQTHVELLLDQRAVCDTLRQSHQENLDRLNKIEQQDALLSRMHRHQNSLENTAETLQRVERDQIENELQMREIRQEVEFQEECLQQYLLLQQKYSAVNPETDVPAQLKQELKQLLAHLEDENAA